MSGHSKWATIKHKKGATDAKRGKLFNKLARQIEVAAKGGGDVDMNPTLRTAVQKAKGAQMTNDAIDRAIKRGTGAADGAAYESIMYEGYAPGGVALMIDVLTDNRNRSGADIRQIFSKLGGSMAEPGAVGWQFARKGVIIVAGAGVDEDELMMAALEAGAEDMARSRSSLIRRRCSISRQALKQPVSPCSRPTRRCWPRTSSRSLTSKTPRASSR
jgi:YebC/PmpR family DNA-binding regulatory protein